MEAFAHLQLSDKQTLPIAIIRDGKYHFIQLPKGQRLGWKNVWAFEKRYNATIRVNAGFNSFNVRFN